MIHTTCILREKNKLIIQLTMLYRSSNVTTNQIYNGQDHRIIISVGIAFKISKIWARNFKD